jgi:hypothetical protein
MHVTALRKLAEGLDRHVKRSLGMVLQLFEREVHSEALLGEQLKWQVSASDPNFPFQRRRQSGE